MLGGHIARRPADEQQKNNMNINPKLWKYAFHPATVLVVSIIATAAFALLIYMVFDGDRRRFVLYYSVPIGVPFVCFVFDRAERYIATSKAVLWVIDLAVLTPALTRAVILIPLISGHALFLSYSLLTSQSRTARITALLIMLQVAYIKIFLWRDVTILGGVIVGGLAALVYRQLRLTNQNIRVTT